MNTEKLMLNCKSYIINKIDLLSQDNPLLGFLKPIITRVINNNFNKMDNILSLLKDDSGNIDIDGILTEMIDNLTIMKSTVIPTSFIGDIELGEGFIKLNIPLTSKKLVLNTEDLKEFKELLTINT